uniref:G_PROTEIN_RECEP_F1_2 domain-containing protein n=1 Tax=Meloidogyne hapla TaxID=6305 RepID=A0A1I8BPD4_MELHA
MNQTQCFEAEASVRESSYNIVRVFHISAGIIFTIMLIRIICSYRANSLKLHKNIIFVLLTYSDPCDCLTQVWVVYLFRMPSYLYLIGSPLFHLAIMIERVLATINVKIYENQGKKFGVICTIIVVNSLIKL